MSRRFACRPMLLLLFLVAVGCTSVVDQVRQTGPCKWLERFRIDGTEVIELAVVDPTSPGTANIRSIAVLDFKADNKIGAALAATLVAQLATTRRFEPMERSNIEQVASKEETPAQLGAKLGADAVLVGEVVGLEQHDSADAKGKTAPLETLGGSTAAAVNQEVRTRQGTMTLDFRLLDCKTGKVLLTRRTKVAEKIQGLASFDKLEPSPSEAEALQRLLDKVAEKVVAELAQPGHRTVKTRFACARGKVNRGNRFARNGVNDHALELYQAALEENKNNDAALYNIGLLLEASGDYPGAGKHFAKAMKLCECDLYIEAYQRALLASPATYIVEGSVE